MPRKKSPVRGKILKEKTAMFDLMSANTESEMMCLHVKKDLRERLREASKDSKVSQNKIVNMSLLYYLTEAGY